MKRAVFSWSGGKDSALALHKVQQEGNYDVRKLVTTVNKHHSRITMHGVRETLLEQQAQAIGIPLEKIWLPEQPGMEEYDRIMAEAMQRQLDEGMAYAIYGDIFLEDLRAYREQEAAKHGMALGFPIWGRDTKQLLAEFIELGFKAVLVSLKAELMDKSFAGRVIDEQFIDDIPDAVDPCGENGEFHTFVFDGPIFKQPVEFTVGEVIHRSYDAPDADESGNQQMGFWFCDLVPG